MAVRWKDLFSRNLYKFKAHSMGSLFDYLKDPGIISLAGGLPSPEMFPVTHMRAVSENRLNSDILRIMQYRPIQGEPDLIEAVLSFLECDRIFLKPENILITSSGQHGLDLTGRLFLNTGEGLLVDRPTFSGALTAFTLQNPRIMGADIQGDGSNIEEFKRMIHTLNREQIPCKFIYVVPDFQNPSGITMSLEKRKALLELSYETGIPIVEDSPYRDFRYSGNSLPSLFGLDQQKKGSHVIGIYTFSKLFCPGIRVGFVIAPAGVISRMTEIKEGNVFNTPKYNQDMCTAFLNEMDLEGHIQKCRQYYGKKLEVFLEAMENSFPPETGIRWTRPEGGLFLWVTAPEQVNTMEWLHRALKRRVAFVPGTVFYPDHPPQNDFRVNFSFASRENLAEAVRRMAECYGSPGLNARSGSKANQAFF